MRQFQLQCAACDAIQPHSQRTPRHVMHALITLFLVGAWLPIWIFVAATAGDEPGVCVRCGNRRRSTGPATVYNAREGQWGAGVIVAILASVIAVAVIGSVIADRLW